MRALIICEYNPFHLGHKYQISFLKNLGFTEIICFMSPYVVQRGEFAIQSKIERARNAVISGANLVIQAPTPLVLQSADYYGQYLCQKALSFKPDKICFGVSNINLDDLCEAVKILSEFEKKPFEKSLSVYDAIKSNMDDEDNSFKKVLSCGNNILAMNYMKVLINRNLKELALPVNRIDSYSINKRVISATKIRKLMVSNKNYMDYLPSDSSLETICNPNAKTAFINNIFLYKYFNDFNFSSTPGFEPGIDNYLFYKFSESPNLENLSSKKYSNSRLKRFILNSALNITKDSVLKALAAETSLRVLASDIVGIGIIKELRSDLNIILNSSELAAQKDELSKIEKLAAKFFYYPKSYNSLREPELSISTFYKK